jgi:ribonuclease P protein component
MPPGARAQALPRRHRFTTQGAFGPILRAGRKARGNHVVIHAVAGATGASRIGTALSRRHVPSAVERNRIKRIVRETFRRHAVKGAVIDCVVMVRHRLDPGLALGAEIGRLLDELYATGAR